MTEPRPPGTPAGSPVCGRRWHTPAACIALFVVCLGAYLARPTEFLGNDTFPAALTAVSLAKRGDVDLDEYASIIRGNRADWPYYVLPTIDGHVMSRFGMGPAIAAWPVFAPVLAVKEKLSEGSVMALARAVASLYVAATAVLVFLAARRLGVGLRLGVAVALVYALGTTAFSVASQALWQHGPAQFALALGLLLLLGGRRRPIVLAAAGAAFAFMVVCRPPDAPLAAAAACAVVLSRRRDPGALAAFFAGALPLALVQLAFNHQHFGAPWAFAQTQIVAGQDALPHRDYWDSPPWLGLAGLLVSPSRGLFVYSPVFVALVMRPGRVWRDAPVILRALLVGTVALVLILSRYYGWYGGWCFGYRMIADAAPVLVLALVPVLAGLGRRGWGAFAAAAAASVAIHAAGAYNYSPGGWDMHPALDQHTERLWSVRDSQLVYVFTRRKEHVPP